MQAALAGLPGSALLVRIQVSESTAADPAAGVDLRDAMVRMLQQLPPRQRTVIVLRYWEQRTEAEIAALLGCSQSAVKSAAFHGLHRLRELAGPLLTDEPEPAGVHAPLAKDEP